MRRPQGGLGRQHAYPAKGETITPAPLIADGKVVIGSW